jgi:hypothetical protein
MPINHRRFIWLSNAAWLSSKIKAVEAKKVADEAAKILKEGVAKRKREAAERAAAIANANKRNKPKFLSLSMLKHGILSAIDQQKKN